MRLIIQNIQSWILCYRKAKLLDEEISVFEQYRYLVEPLIRKKYYQWLIANPGDECYLKILAILLYKLLKSNAISGDKDKFIRKLFSKSMETSVRINIDGFTIGDKSDEHYDIFFELTIINCMVSNGFTVNINGERLTNGGYPEFIVRKDDISIAIEAKSLNRTILSNIIWPMITAENQEKFCNEDGYLLDENQQRKIREFFKNQYKKAKTKFNGYKNKYLIFINVRYDLSLFGEKFHIYLNKINFEDDNYIGLCICCDGEIWGIIYNDKSTTNLTDLIPNRNLQ